MLHAFIIYYICLADFSMIFNLFDDAKRGKIAGIAGLIKGIY